MNIKNFKADTSKFSVELSADKPICFIRGGYSDFVLDLMRELIGDYISHCYLDNVNDGFYVLHADIEDGSKNYQVCYIRNADGAGDNRIGVNFDPDCKGLSDFSRDDTYEFLKKRKKWRYTLNVLIGAADPVSIQKDRPIFIYDYFDRLDIAIDTTPIIEKLISTGGQVFISVCGSYPDEKMLHEGVQIIDMCEREEN